MYKCQQHITFTQRMVQGAIGKKYVIKHYKHRIVKTKYPDMTGIIASDKQRACRDSFGALNAIVKVIYNNPVQRAEWKIKLGNPPHLYGAIFKAYRRELEEVKIQRIAVTNRIIRKSFEGFEENEFFYCAENKKNYEVLVLNRERSVKSIESG